MNIGLLILRLVLGLLLLGHGSQKLFGTLGGPGISGAGKYFDSIGFRPGKPMAIVAGSSELGAGILLILGLLIPLASTAVIGTLLVAGSVHWAAGLWAQKGGYELALFYSTGASALAFTGPGTYSLDHALGLGAMAGNIWGIAAAVAGVLAGLAVIARGRRMLLVDPAAILTQSHTG
jgi:putative oxidoreductase